ncbi:MULTISPECIES: hypothetical protein [unclassified Nocardia]|uniref:hypothetical protein n=1 Tax=unclassified Nocardia TaxID=2637762 RepID=UPI001CE3D7BE|nr:MULTISPECIES: hypothetical protein [unclassified Nocardia]
MAILVFPRHISLFSMLGESVRKNRARPGLTVLSVLGESARKQRARHTLTPQERANLRASRGRNAIFTASLGGHTTY